MLDVRLALSFHCDTHRHSFFSGLSLQPSSVSSLNKILFQSKAIFLHFSEGPRKIKVKKHARLHTPKAAKLSTCSPQQAGVRNYSSVELSFLYRGIISKKKPRLSALEISMINRDNKACARQLGNFDVVELGLARLSTSLTSSTLHNRPSFSSLCSQPCSQRFHTNHNAVDLQVPRVDQRTPKKKKEKTTSDRHHFDKKAAAEISCALRYAVRGAAARTRHHVCGTNFRHALRMRSHEM